MLKPVIWQEGEESLEFASLVQYCDRLPEVFRARMEQLEEIHRWLGSFFEAAAIMLQIPGAADYRWFCDAEDGATDFIRDADRDMLLSILAETFEHLDAGPLIDQVPGADSYRRCEPPVKLQRVLAKRDRNGAMNIAAECLDVLMVIPDLPEEERCLHETVKPRPRAWRRAHRRIRGLFRRGGKS